MTGSSFFCDEVAPPSPGSDGVKTFKKRQSSLCVFGHVKSGRGRLHCCRHPALYCEADKTPPHAAFGTGSRKRSGPIGASAKGMPLK